MSKQYKFLLLISIIVLVSIWFLSVKKDTLRKEEVSLIKKEFFADTVKQCLQKEGDNTVETQKKCQEETEKKWEEALILNNAED